MHSNRSRGTLMSYTEALYAFTFDFFFFFYLLLLNSFASFFPRQRVMKMSFVVLWKLCALVVLIGKKYFVMISFSLNQFF